MTTSQLNSQEKVQHCEFCYAEDGKERLIGNYIVHLKSVEVDGEHKLACQSCTRKYVPMLLKRKSHQSTNNSNKILFELRKITTFFGKKAMVVLFLSTIVNAQPPDLFNPPSQAPIDGGLGLLAAAGGVYAWKKLKTKRGENTIE